MEVVESKYRTNVRAQISELDIHFNTNPGLEPGGANEIDYYRPTSWKLALDPFVIKPATYGNSPMACFIVQGCCPLSSAIHCDSPCAWI
jgi:hypothetical protein